MNTVLASAFLLASAVLAAQPAGDLDRKLFEPEAGPRRPAGAVAIPPGDHPLLSIARRMQSAQERMAGGDCGEQTQQAQRETIAELDRLIAQAIGQAQSSSAGKKAQSVAGPPGGGKQSQPPGERAGTTPGGKPRQGRGAPGARTGQLGTGQLRSVFDQVWGELPEQARQQLLDQWSAEQFLPEYATMIEEYFRRLSETEEDKR